MQRTIVGFHQDEEQHWVADLDCGHSQHVRHDPPWQIRPWVITGEGRDQHLGTQLDCKLCDRRELPAHHAAYKRTATFDEATIPAGLRSRHTLKPGVWGVLHVLRGTLRYRAHEPQPVEDILGPGQIAHIPPEVPHEVEPVDAVSFYIEFYKRPGP